MLTLKEFGSKVKTELTNTRSKLIILRIILFLLEVIVFSVAGSLLGLFSFGFWLRPLLERLTVSDDVLICASGFVFLLLICGMISWRSGIRITKKHKMTVKDCLIADSIATVLYILPGLFIYAIYTKGESDWVKVMITYMPYLCFRNVFNSDFFSLLCAALLTVGYRTGLFALGRLLWRHRGGEDQI